MQGNGAGAGGSDDLPVVSYRDFGEQFFSRVVTQERVVGAVDVLAGQPIAFGPMGVGPGRLVKVTVDGAIGAATSRPVFDPELVVHRVELPVDLRFDLDLGLEVHTFEGSLQVPLTLTVRAIDGLRVFIDVTPPRPSEVGIRLKAQGLRASVLQRVAGVEGEVKRFVAKYVAQEVEKPHIRKARVFDVGEQVDRAWASIAPSGSSPTVEAIRGDFVDALEEEILVTAAGTDGAEREP
ncbi:hypothetical protein [Nocardioides marmoribigeumensis]|uniref:Uncharacterized protein n=1 Tax=Nocardioides marmoribigeumensis TaxID=433649 RepID=A0ABU2C0Y8_9ACTN|nr:hypothetical protein [Nocardioides marmoribigeumensis]MDR7364315.1 hypothetical protein [Nocardioides marmoribigeumensis]